MFSVTETLLFSAIKLYGYGSSPSYDVIFGLSFTIGFLTLFLAGRRKKISLAPTQLTMIIAIGIGFQNLTEGLLFGSLSTTMRLTGGALVILVGFIFQNLTEGFPIASSFIERGKDEGKRKAALVITGALLIGGIPTILGGAVGYYYNSTIFNLIFDGLAIGTMLYVILPMLRNLLRETDPGKLSISYFGIFLGFVLGFIVNLLWWD
jgi:ZIP family zinc transporter